MESCQLLWHAAPLVGPEMGSKWCRHCHPYIEMHGRARALLTQHQCRGVKCWCVPALGPPQSKASSAEIPQQSGGLQIFQLLFQRLAAKRTPKFTRGFVIALALFVAKHGGPSMQAGIDSMQPGLFGDFMSNVWGPALPSVSGRHEVKLVVVATTKVGPGCTLGPGCWWLAGCQSRPGACEGAGSQREALIWGRRCGCVGLEHAV